MLDDISIGGAGLNQRTSERFEKLAIFGMASPVFRDLTGAAGDDILMAFPATLRVVGGSEALFEGFNLFEDEPTVVE